MGALLTRPPKIGTETPLFIVSSRAFGKDASSISLFVGRMDGRPETDIWGERFRSDVENWLTRDQAVRLISTMIGGLPRY